MKRRLQVLVLLPVALASGCIFDISPDGEQIVTSRMYLDEPLRETTARATRPVQPSMAIAGAGKTLSALPASAGGQYPAWSPDGRWIAFSRPRKAFPGGMGDGEAMLYHVTDGKSAALKALSPALTFFSWRADSRQVLAVRGLPGKQGVITQTELAWCDVPGGRVARRLKFTGKLAMLGSQRPRWLGDEAALLVGDERGADVHLSQGEAVRRVSTTGDVIALWAAPDGKYLRWARRPFAAPGRARTAPLQVWQMDVATRQAVRLPFKDPLPRPDDERGWHSEGNALFSPDGESLAVVDTFPARDASGKIATPRKQFTALWMATLDSAPRLIHQTPSRPTPLEPHEQEWQHSTQILPVWSRDGGRLVFCVGDIGGGNTMFWRHDVATASTSRVR